ncbi:MAG: PASTA domain-containing protein, partial [Actinomycetes bacterium]
IGSSALTRSGGMMGTSSYISPEQAQGRPADERSDVYSAGVVLFEMLAGKLPFRGESDIAVAMQHVSAAPPNPRSLAPDVPEQTAAAVMRALSKDPAVRFQSAAEFAAALRGAAVTTSGAAAVARGAAGAVAGAAGADRAAASAAKSPPPPVSPRDPTGVAAGDHAPHAAPDPARPTVVAGEALTTPAATRLAAPAAVPTAGGPVQGRSRRRTWLWVAVIVLLLAAVAGGWAVYAYIVNAGPRVPHLVGDARPHAVAAVREQGLRPVVHQGWIDGVDAGTVARQRPRAGQKLQKGARVDLWVSIGPLHIPSPTLMGLNATDAATVLAQQSLGGHRRRAATRKVPVGRIYRQSPEAGATIARGDTVTYWVSTGPPIRPVPDVVGLSEGDAKAALEADGFTVNSDLVVGLGSVPGDVVAQDPAAGTRLRKGDEVVIKVAVF